MAFQMKVDTIAPKRIPPGIYEVRLNGFKPKLSNDKGSVNFNAQMEIINNPEYDGSKIFEGLNSKAGFVQADFTHSFGYQMEDAGNGTYNMPGFWDGDPATFNSDDPSTWKYEGPLLNRIAKVELGTKTWNGQEQIAIKRYFCALPENECKAQGVRHSENLLKKQG